MGEFPGLIDFFVTDDTTEGVVIGWRDGYLVVLVSDRTLKVVDPMRVRVTGKAVFNASDDEGEVIIERLKEKACA